MTRPNASLVPNGRRLLTRRNAVQAVRSIRLGKHRAQPASETYRHGFTSNCVKGVTVSVSTGPSFPQTSTGEVSRISLRRHDRRGILSRVPPDSCLKVGKLAVGRNSDLTDKASRQVARTRRAASAPFSLRCQRHLPRAQRGGEADSRSRSPVE